MFSHFSFTFHCLLLYLFMNLTLLFMSSNNHDTLYNPMNSSLCWRHRSSVVVATLPHRFGIQEKHYYFYSGNSSPEKYFSENLKKSDEVSARKLAAGLWQLQFMEDVLEDMSFHSSMSHSEPAKGNVPRYHNVGEKIKKTKGMLQRPKTTPHSRNVHLRASKDSRSYEFTSMKSLNQPKNGFWDVLARRAKSIIEDDNIAQQSEMPATTRSKFPGLASRGKFQNSNHLEGSNLKRDSPALLKGLDAFASSLNHIGGTIGKSLEEGFTIVENRTSDIIQETRKHIRKKPGNSVGQNQETSRYTTLQQSQLRTQMSEMQTGQELQLKASRDVAMAMATKAKLLLRELKTVKADLAFAKDRCAQLEEENKILRENRERGDSQEDDDLIRLQLETLLAEKARLAHENSIYARENRFLREVVEYHQLTMQDVVYLDENNEEVTEVNPLNFPPVPTVSLQSITPSITSLSSPPETNRCTDSEFTTGISSPISGKDAKNSEVTVKDSKSSEVTRSISSITGKGAK